MSTYDILSMGGRLLCRTPDGVGGVKESWGILPLGVASLYSRV